MGQWVGSGQITNKEASRLYAELCEPMLKFFILVSRNEPDC